MKACRVKRAEWQDLQINRKVPPEAWRLYRFLTVWLDCLNTAVYGIIARFLRLFLNLPKSSKQCRNDRRPLSVQFLETKMKTKHITALVLMTSAYGCGMDLPFKKSNESKAADPAQPTVCQSEGCKDPDTRSPEEIQRAGLFLRSFQTCEEAENYFETRLIQQLRAQVARDVENYKKYSQRDWNYSGGIEPMDSRAASPEAVTSNADGGGASEKSSPTDYTTTNNQEVGVEESDIIKNTGTHIYQVSGRAVQIVKSWPVNDMASIAKIEIKGKPFELMLSDDQKLVILYHPEGVYTRNFGQPIENDGSENISDLAPISPSSKEAIPAIDSNSVFVEVHDVKDPAKPALLEKYSLEGRFLQARRIGGTIRLVLQSYHAWPKGFRYPSAYDQKYSGGRISVPDYNAKIYASLAAAEQKILEQNLSFWLSQQSYVKVTAEGGSTPILDLNGCSNIHAPEAPSDLNFTRVVSINLSNDSVKETVLMSSASQVYSSQKSLYVMNPFYWYNQEKRETDYSFVHQFDLTDENEAHYLGSGGIEGTALNQFSMDEHEDHLRIAATVTKYAPSSSDNEINWSWRGETVNRVYVMNLKDKKLNIVGQTDDLAKGERVYSARFEGNRGFVVTFRQVDPLFTLDLSDPTKPKVVGELKIPGFSSYIHMMDDKHLLTVGQDADLNGRVRGVKISIFDVSDMSNPSEVQSYALGAGSWSEANWDHKAFTYFPAKKLLAIPVHGYESSSAYRYFSKLLVLNVDPANEISEKGSVNVGDLVNATGKESYWWYGAASVQRSIFADDFVYAISNIGIKAVNIADFDQAAGKVSYECQGSCLYDGYWY
jgi:uncharacterized secreted protein with C-terminal beta-propeller domain